MGWERGGHIHGSIRDEAFMMAPSYSVVVNRVLSSSLFARAADPNNGKDDACEDH